MSGGHTKALCAVEERLSKCPSIHQDYQLIAKLCISFHELLAENEALQRQNAELLAACKAFSARYGDLWDHSEGGSGFLPAESVASYDAIHEQMEAAIALAEGSKT